MTICSACGTVAPRPDLPCSACGARESTSAPDRTGRLFFVGVRCQFQCRGCGRLAPLDEVDMDGLVRCALCGLTQAYDPTAWTEALAQAHALGDLADGEGLHPHARWAIGPRNPHHDVGRTRSTVLVTLSGVTQRGGMEVQRSLRMSAGPGHPVCGRCHVAVTVDLPSSGQARTRCPQCGDSRAYAVDAGVLDAAPGLRAVLAEGHRGDQRDARATDGNGGVVGLSCPGCGAPLRVEGHARTVTCAFCHLACRIPGEFAVGAAEAPPTPFWLVFSGPSAFRRALEHEPGGAEADGPLPIRPPPVGQVSPSGFWLGMLPSVVVAGGMTVGVGVILFLLMRAGVLRI